MLQIYPVTTIFRPRVLLIDPCPVTRFGIREALINSPLCIGDTVEANHINDIPMLMESHLPQIIVMELIGDGESVLDSLRMIGSCKRYKPAIPVIICTEILHENLFHMLMSLGVNGIYMKKEPVNILVQCVEKALSGNKGNSDGVNELFSHTDKTIASLTEKELKVLEFILDGKSVTNTAKLMSRDIRTISSHKRNAMTKFGFRNDGEMFSNAKWMTRNGLSY